MQKKKVFDDPQLERLVLSVDDGIYRFVLADKAVRGVLVRGTRMVNEMRANHELGILETMVLGQAYIGAALLSANLKGEDRISLQVECSGPIKGLMAEANAKGEVRGYLNQVPIPVEKPLEDMDLSSFFGAGFLSVTKYLKDAKQPFTGKIMLQYGNLAKDISNYFLTSEQIPTATTLSFQFDQEGVLVGAGGLFVQAMPGAEESLMQELEQTIEGLPSLGAYFVADGKPEQLIAEQFQAFSPEILEHHPVQFFCPCSEERFQSVLMGLPDNDWLEILEKGPFPLELQCHYCNSFYHFEKDQIEKLWQKRRQHKGNA